MARSTANPSPTGKAIDIAVHIGILALLLAWCLLILKPFVSLVIWAIIIAVTAYPLYRRLNQRLGDRRKLTAALLVAAALLLLIVPSVQLAVSSADSVQSLYAKVQDRQLRIPPPPDDVRNWPLVGDTAHGLWLAASVNLEALLAPYRPQLFAAAKWVLGSIMGTVMGVLGFAASVVIAGILLATAQGGGLMVRRLFVRVAGERGIAFAEISEKTVRSVVKGIIGVSILQSLLAGLGMAVAGVPGAGLWALLCLILAVVQIGIGPVILPVIVYAFWKMGTLTAVALTVWLVALAVADGPLKAVIFGRGAPVPMLVIFLGAIGGFLSIGFLGLFIGAVVLSVSYKLFETWLQEGALPPRATGESAGSAGGEGR
jgi:predicted PurR-regulated permease PerM